LARCYTSKRLLPLLLSEQQSFVVACAMVDKMGFPLPGGAAASSTPSINVSNLYFPVKPTVRDIRNVLGDAVGEALAEVDRDQLESLRDIEDLKLILKEVKAKADIVGKTVERKREEVVNLHTRQQHFLDEAENLQRPIDAFISECKILETTYMRCSGVSGSAMKASPLQVPNQEYALYINELHTRKEAAYRKLEAISETVESLQTQPPPSGQLHCLSQVLTCQQWTFERLHKKTSALHDHTERLKARVPHAERLGDGHNIMRR